jgi:hypothetical protein
MDHIWTFPIEYHDDIMDYGFLCTFLIYFLSSICYHNPKGLLFKEMFAKLQISFFTKVP